MPKSKPVPMLVAYHPKKGGEKALLALVRRHGAALRRAGLITRHPVRVWKASDKRSGAVHFVEMFQWKDGKASGTAHHTPGIMAIWGPMGEVLERLELTVIEPVSPGRGRG